jgi:hypothetical protein
MCCRRRRRGAWWKHCEGRLVIDLRRRACAEPGRTGLARRSRTFSRWRPRACGRLATTRSAIWRAASHEGVGDAADCGHGASPRRRPGLPRLGLSGFQSVVGNRTDLVRISAPIPWFAIDGDCRWFSRAEPLPGDTLRELCGSLLGDRRFVSPASRPCASRQACVGNPRVDTRADAVASNARMLRAPSRVPHRVPCALRPLGRADQA